MSCVSLEKRLGLPQSHVPVCILSICKALPCRACEAKHPHSPLAVCTSHFPEVFKNTNLGARARLSLWTVACGGSLSELGLGLWRVRVQRLTLAALTHIGRFGHARTLHMYNVSHRLYSNTDDHNCLSPTTFGLT